MFENRIEPTEPRRRPVAAKAHTDDIAKQHNLYTAQIQTFRGPARVYYADYQEKSVVMRAHETRITTKLDDRQTVSAMLDLAESRGWDRLNLRGTDNFKREAWVQAQIRGLEVKGYEPKTTDQQEAARRKAAAKPVEKPAEKAATAPAPAKAKAKPPEAAQQQRSQERAVWNVVETTGKAAREQAGASKPAEKVAEKQPAASVAVAA
jgi:hypothetical protein